MKTDTVEAYTSFAAVYDTFMDNVPYQMWSHFLHKQLVAFDAKEGLVVDLGCGTGSMTELLADLGYDMIGIDNSAEMLEIALNKKVQSNHDILYLLQDMREFELYGTVKAMISICDCLNYITEAAELGQVFHWVENYLEPGGVFIFDFNTDYKYRELLGNQTIAENREECSFIWENYYYEEERINEYQLSLFVKEGNLYRRFQETHFQRGYTLTEMQEMLATTKLEFIKAYDGFSEKPVTKTSERILIIARKR